MHSVEKRIYIGKEYRSESEVTKLIKERMESGQIQAAIDIIEQIGNGFDKEFYQTHYASRFIQANNIKVAQQIINGMQEGRARDHWQGMVDAKKSSHA